MICFAVSFWGVIPYYTKLPGIIVAVITSNFELASLPIIIFTPGRKKYPKTRAVVIEDLYGRSVDPIW